MNKKIILPLFIFASFFLVIIFLLRTDPALADFRDTLNQQTQAAAGSEGAGFATAEDPRIIAVNVIRILLSFIGTLFLAYTVYAGYMWMTSAGDEGKIDKAKSTLRTAVIGVLVILGSYTITTLVSRSLLNVTTAEESFFRSFIHIRQDTRLNNVNRDPLDVPNTTPFTPEGGSVNVIDFGF